MVMDHVLLVDFTWHPRTQHCHSHISLGMVFAMGQPCIIEVSAHGMVILMSDSQSLYGEYMRRPWSLPAKRISSLPSWFSALFEHIGGQSFLGIIGELLVSIRSLVLSNTALSREARLGIDAWAFDQLSPVEAVRADQFSGVFALSDIEMTYGHYWLTFAMIHVG